MDKETFVVFNVHYNCNSSSPLAFQYHEKLILESSGFKSVF